MTIGERIHQILKQKSLKQIDLASAIGTNQSTISGWGTGGKNPSSEFIYPICNFLNVSIEHLLTGNEVKEQPSINEDEKELLELWGQLDKADRSIIKGEMYKMIKVYKQPVNEEFSKEMA